VNRQLFTLKDVIQYPRQAKAMINDFYGLNFFTDLHDSKVEVKEFLKLSLEQIAVLQKESVKWAFINGLLTVSTIMNFTPEDIVYNADKLFDARSFIEKMQATFL
jgi:hypothetical protein